jgi:hypothetical protein
MDRMKINRIDVMKSINIRAIFLSIKTSNTNFVLEIVVNIKSILQRTKVKKTDVLISSCDVLFKS